MQALAILRCRLVSHIMPARQFSQSASHLMPIPPKSEKKTNDSKVVVVTSGKGGVGKTTTTASFGYGLALEGYKTCVIDFDIGLRNLDLHLGMERRVVYDFVNVIREEATLHQALIKDRKEPNLYLLAASQTRDKTALTEHGVRLALDELRDHFDYILADSPAGIESGAYHAMYFADEAIICTNPEISSVRDSDKMIGILNSKSEKAIKGDEPPQSSILITRYDPERVESETMLSVDDIVETLSLPLVGVIPESKDVLDSTNVGQPVIAKGEGSWAANAYRDMVKRYLGQQLEFRYLNPQPKSFFSRFFSK